MPRKKKPEIIPGQQSPEPERKKSGPPKGTRPPNPFPKGNKLWQMMDPSVVLGAPPEFKTPQELLDRALPYFKWQDAHPWERQEQAKGRSGYVKNPSTGKYKLMPDVVSMKVRVPYTIEGLCIFMGVTTHWWRDFKNTKNYQRDPGFAAVINFLTNIIYQDKFTGAAGGFFNSNIIARDLGLKDHTESKLEVHEIDYEKLPPEVLEAIIKAAKHEPAED